MPKPQPMEFATLVFLQSRLYRFKQEIRIFVQKKLERRNLQAVFVRNNLTGVELLEMTARGVHGELRFGTTAMMSGALSESGGSLKFDVSERHLKDCYRKFEF